ncbi:hypothetical protein FRB90_012301 [Tulasnella sp. 427]|nr:hypothetical protein FRB90_012301 [Tulasnella sp. 427]
MRPTVVISTSLLALSPLILAIENARPQAQIAHQEHEARQHLPAKAARPRDSPRLMHWDRQIIISGSISNSEAQSTPTSSSEPPTSTPSSTSTPPTTSSSSDPPTTTSSSPPTTTSRSISSSQSLTGLVSTGSNGGVSTVFQTVTNSATMTSSSASPSSTDASNDNSGVGGKSIAGIVVAGVLAILGIGGFIWWKMSKKRFSGLEDTEDNFKWPDLNENTAMQPLPGRAESVRGGHDAAGGTTQSELSHGKPYYDNQSAISSAADLSRGPVEHAQSTAYYDNPNYHGASSDAASGYYDPYSGPVPEVFSPQAATGPTFAMDAGRRSPGPNNAYDASGYGGRTASPGPNAAYAPRSGSPGPNVAYGAPRAASPGPNVAYGAPRAASPGPNVAYGAPRAASPGPNAAYGARSASPGPGAAYGARSASPGPGAAYGAYGARSASPGPNYAYGGQNNFGQH